MVNIKYQSGGHSKFKHRNEILNIKYQPGGYSIFKLEYQSGGYLIFKIEIHLDLYLKFKPYMNFLNKVCISNINLIYIRNSNMNINHLRSKNEIFKRV